MVGTALRIIWDVWDTTGELFWVINAIFGRRRALMTADDYLKRLKQEPAWFRILSIVMAVIINFWVPYVVPFIWNAYWTITTILANQGHVLGDEYIFTFGQVGALVAFFASFYAIGNSYISKPWATA